MDSSAKLVLKTVKYFVSANTERTAKTGTLNLKSIEKYKIAKMEATKSNPHPNFLNLYDIKGISASFYSADTDV